MMTSPLYTEIIHAIGTATELGAFRERHKGETMSSREAVKRYGTKAVAAYRRIYGTPQRTGSADNSKLRYRVDLLEAVKAANEIESCVVAFEVKVRRSQRALMATN